jgi:uncharacterized protein
MSYATITALNVYPVKSCRGIPLDKATLEMSGVESDRRWLVVNESGRFMTQRELPRLALVVPTLTERGGLSLTAPGMPTLNVWVEIDAPVIRVTVFSHQCAAFDAGSKAAEWLSHFLARPVRLVRFDPRVPRAIDPRLWKGDVDVHVEFPDAFPLMILSQASLEDLNSRLESPLPMNRFRPNVVLDGCEPYEEDRIHELRDGALRLQMGRPCTRCTITTTDQLTGEASSAEPLATLKTYRWSKELRGLMFGQYAVVAGGVGSQLRVGQRLEIVHK